MERHAITTHPVSADVIVDGPRSRRTGSTATQLRAAATAAVASWLDACLTLPGIHFADAPRAMKSMTVTVDRADRLSDHDLEFLCRLAKLANVTGAPVRVVLSCPDPSGLRARLYRVYPDSVMMFASI